MLVWGSPPVFVKASYTIYNKDGTNTTRSSLLLGQSAAAHSVFRAQYLTDWLTDRLID